VALLPRVDPTSWGEGTATCYRSARAEWTRNGNAVHHVWADGPVVGGWGQRGDGVVRRSCLEPVDTTRGAGRRTGAAALTDWLEGTVGDAAFRTPLSAEITAR